MSVKERDEYITRQVKILEAIEKILKREDETDEILDVWIGEPSIITTPPCKYVYYSVYVYSKKHRVFKIPILEQTYYNNELIEEKLYTAKEALEKMSTWKEE
jgi:hypothetical protein